MTSQFVSNGSKFISNFREVAIVYPELVILDDP
jgi:hypothetical protein